jgi:hypothetical protein
MKLFQNAFYAALLLAASACIAQTPGSVVAVIPFPFVVAGRTLPAGRYIVSPVNDNILRIHESMGPGVMVLTNAAQRSHSDTSSKLVFHGYQGTYFLSQVWTTGNERGREVLRSPEEREMATKMMQKGKTVVAAVR